MKTVQKLSLISRRRLLVALGLFFAACLAGPSSAQTGGDTGTITGRVTNKATGESLVNAVVTVPAAHVTAVCQRGGTYSVSVPAGTYILEVNYTGLDDAKFTVAVTANQTTVQDVAMSAEIYKLDKYVE